MIGMPACGKSMIGVLLAKRIGYAFLDMDLVIQEREGQLLKEIIAKRGMDGFAALENQVCASVDVRRTIIAPGGSVVYGREAMAHLKSIGQVIYLKLGFEALCGRIGDVVDRGVVLRPGMTLRDLYDERVPMYERYADITIDEDGKGPGEVVDELRALLEKRME
ncbi:MAG: shikimate kinase [Lachnospiraceae bacterium]|jgi:shikimate kinase|nr:shikimate kinase [Lachnospiraceae bacterium]